jgi:hypothetical protein
VAIGEKKSVAADVPLRRAGGERLDAPPGQAAAISILRLALVRLGAAGLSGGSHGASIAGDASIGR